MRNVKKWTDRTEWIAAAVLLALAGVFLWAARKVPGFAEWYSSTVYPALVTVIGGFYGLVPVSVVELILYVLAVLLVILMIRYIRKPVCILKHYSLIAGILLFSYASCCGVNYYRVPFSSYYIYDMQTRQNGVQETKATNLHALCAWLTEEVNRTYDALDASEGNFEDMKNKGVAAMKRLAEQYPPLAGYYPKPKPVLMSEILSIQQCSGVYSPFTIEANYNNDMVTYNIPHTICHEMSHLRGFMREDEANFIGYLACLLSEDVDFRYSGYMLGWIYAGNALAKADMDEYTRLHGLLREEVREELEENSEFWARYEGEVAETQEKVNDAYLKANGQVEGVLTYGRVVDLMLIDYAYNRGL